MHVDIGGHQITSGYDHAGQLTQRHGTAGSTGTAPLNQRYGYDSAGQLIEIRDLALDKTTTYAYDWAGNRVLERTAQAGVTVQDNHLAYDALGRLRVIADGRVHVAMEYDLNGNRTRIQTHVSVPTAAGDASSDTGHDTVRHFLYDAMNRQTVVDGIDASGTLAPGQGHRIAYDLNGNRIGDTFYGNRVLTAGGDVAVTYLETGEAVYGNSPYTYRAEQGLVVEQYAYDGMNRLQSIARDGIQLDHRKYDAASRVIETGPGNLPVGYAAALNQHVPASEAVGLENRLNQYDANGRLIRQLVLKSDGSPKFELESFHHDTAGNVLGYRLQEGGKTTTYSSELTHFDGYLQQRQTATSGSATATSHSVYDANGHLAAVSDSAAPANNRTFINDAEGRALSVKQGEHIERQLIVNGEVLGRFGVGVDALDPRGSSNAPNFRPVAEFSFGYQPINGHYPGASPGVYTVRQGDTLQSIARGAYGDSKLWYRIAEANGLGGDRDLRVGQTLNVPALAGGVHNDAETFQPYDASRITGDTSPALPMPGNGGGCGGVGQVIMIVVAIVVTVYTAGTAAGAWGAFGTAGTAPVGATFGATLQTGAAALTGGYGTTGIAAAAVGGAVGSVASQAVGNVIGAQDGFSWKQVAMSAIGAGVSSGLGGALNGVQATLAGSGLNDTFVRAATTNALTQGAGVALGLQDGFSWRSVAAAAVGTGVGEAVGSAAAASLGASPLGRFGAGVVSGLAGGATAASLRGGRVTMQQVAIDAFGNALGSGLARAASSAYNHSGEGTAASPYVDPGIGDHIVFGKPYQSDRPQVQRFLTAFEDASAPPVDRSDVMWIAAADGLRLGHGPVSMSQRGRTVYITDQDVERPIDALLAGSRADLKRLQRSRDEALTAELNRNSVIRETVRPFFEPITIEVPSVLNAVVGGVGDVATGAIAGLADVTVAPLADLAQAGLKTLHGAVTGDHKPLVPLSTYADSVVNKGAGTWEGIKNTGANVFNLSPLGMIYHSGAGGYGLATAAMNGEVRAATREGLGLGLIFAGASVIPVGVGRTASSPSLSVQVEISALQRIAANNRAARPWADLRRAYHQARGQVDFAHIEADVTFKANGQVKAYGGHFSTSPQLQRIRSTEIVSPNGVIYGQVKLLGPDGKFHLKTNNGGFSSMTPDSWSLARAKGEMSLAWVNRRFDPVDQVWIGSSTGIDFLFYQPTKKIPMWRGYPVQP